MYIFWFVVVRFGFVVEGDDDGINYKYFFFRVFAYVLGVFILCMVGFFLFFGF